MSCDIGSDRWRGVRVVRSSVMHWISASVFVVKGNEGRVQVPHRNRNVSGGSISYVNIPVRRVAPSRRCVCVYVRSPDDHAANSSVLDTVRGRRHEFLMVMWDLCSGTQRVFSV